MNPFLKSNFYFSLFKKNQKHLKNISSFRTAFPQTVAQQSSSVKLIVFSINAISQPSTSLIVESRTLYISRDVYSGLTLSQSELSWLSYFLYLMFVYRITSYSSIVTSQPQTTPDLHPIPFDLVAGLFAFQTTDRTSLARSNSLGLVSKCLNQ